MKYKFILFSPWLLKSPVNPKPQFRLQPGTSAFAKVGPGFRILEFRV